MAATNGVCPACGHLGLVSTVKRLRLPAMQNYVFRRADLARAAKSGQFDLGICRACGFAHNTCFDPALLNYDQGYDNSVPSSVMTAYYKEIATYLHEEYSLDDGLVLDIGCGKGTFLQLLCDTFPRVRGLGIDPSYEGDGHTSQGRVEFIKDVFSAKRVGERPSLVVCRHVLEHIPDPTEFLRSIHSSLEGFPEVPLFFEVPDTLWIMEASAFWDFCYEHCNYFTAASLSSTLELSGFTPGSTRTAFGSQYISIEVRNTQGQPKDRGGADRMAAAHIVERAVRYSNNEVRNIAEMRHALHDLKKDGWSVAIWGMATKGVVFSFLVDPDGALIDFCIDVNENKQGCFVPLTGHAIQAPEVLSRSARERLAIVVMNPNYSAEIREMCKTLALSPAFLDANGNRI